jgi:hypothetical protein
MTFNIVVNLKDEPLEAARHNTWDRGMRMLSVSEGFAAQAQLPIRVVAFETRIDVIVLVGHQLSSARD